MTAGNAAAAAAWAGGGGTATGHSSRRGSHMAAVPAPSVTEGATAAAEAEAVGAPARTTAPTVALTAPSAVRLEPERARSRTAAATDLLREPAAAAAARPSVVGLAAASLAAATAAPADHLCAPPATVASAAAEAAAAASAASRGAATPLSAAPSAATDSAREREASTAAASEGGGNTYVPCDSVSRRWRQMFVCDAVHATAASACGTMREKESSEEHLGGGGKPEDFAAAASSSSEDEEDEEESSRWQTLHKGVAGEQQQTVLFSRDTDVMYEQELQRDPFQVKIWCRYLDSKKEDSSAERCLIYERALSSLPGSYKLWWRYLQERVTQAAGAAVAAAAVHSAAAALSGSAAAGKDVGGGAEAGTQTPPHSAPPAGVRSSAQRRCCEEVNKVFERALVLLLHMPKMWIFYLRFLQHQQLITRTRRALDRALQSVAITQHDALWRCCMPFFREKAPVETTVRLYRRCVMRLPEETEAFVKYLQQPHVGRYDHAAELLAELVEDETRSSLAAAAAGGGKTKHQLWLQLCDLVAAHPARIRSLDPEKVLRSGIARFSDEVGRLWCSLASIFLRLGEIEKARDIFEEAVQSVRTVQDLALVYDAYLNFEEGLLAAKIEQQQQRRSSAGRSAARRKSKKNSGTRHFSAPHAADAAAAPGRGSRASAAAERSAAAADAAMGRGDRETEQGIPGGEEEEDEEQGLDYLMTRLEYLTERRPLLVSSCKLRQNPHNVHEWLARAELFAHDPAKVVETFSEAVASVDPQLAVGRLSVLWLAFGRFYEQHGDLPNACSLFEKAVQVPFRSVDELATVWCEYVEMLLRHRRDRQALQLVRRAINMRPSAPAVSSAAAAPVQNKLCRSVKLWCLAADVEEMFGSLETVRACYNKMFQLKTITPQLVINYAHLLEEHRFFEESFKVYERGIAAFRWPHLNDLWLMYLTKFVSRYGGHQLERARELFQQATAVVPARFARRLFLLYAKLEEEFGLAKHALTIYHAATKAVLDEEKKDMYYIYIARTTELFGIARTRKIYEEAIETLPEKDAREMCMRYALVERGLGEVDRSRAIYEHCAQFCDPSVHPDFWKAWKDFEVAHGNEDTFKDMLRVKRSVIAQYSQAHQSVLELAQSLAAAEEQQQQEAGQRQQEQALAASAAADHTAAQRSSAELKRRAATEEKSVEEELFYKKKRQMDEAELAEAETEFQAVQRQRAQARVVAALPPDAPFFTAAQTFLGPRLGYVFKHGCFGQGYYLDEHQVSAEYYNARVAAAAGPAVQEATGTAAGAGGAAAAEKLSITLSPTVPEAVYGSLAAVAAAAAKSTNSQASTSAQGQQER